jgi:hypothetical protein
MPRTASFAVGVEPPHVRTLRFSPVMGTLPKQAWRLLLTEELIDAVFLQFFRAPLDRIVYEVTGVTGTSCRIC